VGNLTGEKANERSNGRLNETSRIVCCSSNSRDTGAREDTVGRPNTAQHKTVGDGSETRQQDCGAERPNRFLARGSRSVALEVRTRVGYQRHQRIINS